jgi:hypothetical protein
MLATCLPVLQITVFSIFLGFMHGCGVKTPPTPLLPSEESVLDAEVRSRKKEQEKEKTLKK